MRSFWYLLKGSVAVAAVLSANLASVAEERTIKDADIRIDLPEAPPTPLVTTGTEDTGLRLPLPQPPPADIAVDRKDGSEQVGSDSRTEPLPEPKIELAVPESPPAEIVIKTDDLPHIAKAPENPEPEPLKPREPTLAIIAPPAVEKPAEAKPAETTPVEATKHAVMPPDHLRAALQRLKASNRITNAEAADVLAFYETRGFTPLWQDGGGWNSAAKQVRERLALAREEGLDPTRYRSVSSFVSAGEPNWPALAAAETQLTESVVLYARDASNGRIKPGAVHPLITPVITPLAAANTLKQVSEAGDAGAALQAFNPKHAGYQALRKALKDLHEKQQATVATNAIPDGPPLRIGMQDPRVPLIRAHVGLGYDASPMFDRGLAIKLASLQRSNNLPANGIFTPATARLLSGESQTLEEAELIANMERWRWLPKELGKDHIWVNTPEQRVEMIRDGSVIHQATAIVGKLDTQTPVFSDAMDHIVINPSWYVPPGILKKEPKYLDDAWAASRGYTIRRRGETASVRVPPGPKNPLGYVKFMFPNHHAVYLHDTSSRGLFNARVRTLSNGCVRVQNPFMLAAKIFEETGWTEERFKSLIGGGEQRMNLPRKLPIHLTYFTITVDEAGVLHQHPDLYGHSARMRQLLGLS